MAKKNFERMEYDVVVRNEVGMPISFLRFTCKRIIENAWFFDCIFGGFCCWNSVRKRDILFENVLDGRY